MCDTPDQNKTLVGLTMVLGVVMVGVGLLLPHGVWAQSTSAVTTSALPWPWILARGAGIASFIFLTLLSVTGMLLTTGVLYRVMSPAQAWSFHRALASVLLFTVILHIGSLLFDTFIRLKILDLLVPFRSSYRPWLVASGILGFYLLLLVLISSLYTMVSHAKFWRTVHSLSFIMLIAIFLHSVLIGSDTKLLWMKIVYWAAGALVVASIAYRLRWKRRSVRPQLLARNRMLRE